MDLNLIGLATYILYIPLLLIIVIIAALRHKNFFLSKSLLSTLAETASPSYEIFSALIAFFSLLRLIFVFNLSRLLPNIATSKIALIFLFLSCLSGLMIAFYPRDKFRKVHGVFGTSMFVGILASLVFLVVPIYLSAFLPNFIIFINFLIVFLVILQLFSDYLSTHELDGFILKFRSYWQWTLLSLVIAWDFIVAVFTFLNYHH
ncbi:hypothetical protein ACFL0Y_03030 [Patescibacteria group bacterium]